MRRRTTGPPARRRDQLVGFLADSRRLDPQDVLAVVRDREDEAAVRHLFSVAAALDSMVMGEAQIPAQVKQAYELARTADAAGPLTNAAFQAALRVAKRVASETAISQKRVSIPSVAIADFASQIFEHFHDKRVLVLGAGEMGEETLRYLIDEGARDIVVVNRTPERAQQLAARVGGRIAPWEDLPEQLAEADLVIGTTGSSQPVVTAEPFAEIHARRQQRPLFLLDLAVPRDFDPAIGDFPGVYLYSLDDLQRACDENRREREREWPKAMRIIDQETERFMAELRHRATAPTIRQLKARADELKQEELVRLLNKLGPLDDRQRQEIRCAFDRLVNKLLHPPLESLRDAAAAGPHHGLLDALKRLFRLQD